MKKESKGFKIGISIIPTNRYEYLKESYNLDSCPIYAECSTSSRFTILTIDIEMKRKEDIQARRLYLKELDFDLDSLLFNFELYKSVERSATFSGERTNCSNCNNEKHKKHCQLVKPFEYLELGRKKIELELKRIEIDILIGTERKEQIKKVLYDLIEFRTEVFKIEPDISKTKLLQYFVNENNYGEANPKIKHIRKELGITSLKLGRDNVENNYLIKMNALTITESDIKKIIREMDLYLKKNLTFRTE